MRLGETRARLELDDDAQLVVLDLLVALEKHLVDDLGLLDVDHQRRTRLVNARVGEQAGGVEPLHRLVHVGLAEGGAGLDADIVANRGVVDALVALHHDRADYCGMGYARPNEADCHDARKHQAK